MNDRTKTFRCIIYVTLSYFKLYAKTQQAKQTAEEAGKNVTRCTNNILANKQHSVNRAGHHIQFSNDSAGNVKLSKYCVYMRELRQVNNMPIY